MIAALVIILLVALVVALAGAYYESDRIQENLDNGVTEDLDHGSLTVTRVIVIGCTALFATLIATWGDPGRIFWLALVSSLGACYGLFSPVHRYMLNTDRRVDRKLDPRYVSPGNWTDAIFLKLSCLFNKGFPKRIDKLTLRRYYFDWRGRPEDAADSDAVVKTVHRAGTFEYVFEVVILAVSLAIYLNL